MRRVRSTTEIYYGVSLIEAIVGLAILLVAVSIFASFAQTTGLSALPRDRIIAAQLAQEQIETLRRVPYSLLVNGTNMPFRYVPFNHGDMAVTQESGVPANYLLAPTPSTAAPLPVVRIVPGDTYTNGTFSTKVYVNATSTNWAVGLLLQYQDKNNYYFVQLRDTTVRFVKRVGGTETVLYQTPSTQATNTWHTLEVTANGADYTIRLNGLLVTGTPVSDATLGGGAVALAAAPTTYAWFDDVSVTAAQTRAWDFQNAAWVGSLPPEWQRVGIEDLPQGDDRLTIETPTSAPYNSSPYVKFVTSTVTWTLQGQPRSFSLKTIVSQ